ncbi:MAG: molecular chaperone DnaK [Rhodospirillaceae bacterium]|nr:MAG: molecular chaperone DnaK [Rhodospirillaceae bacterium]
MTNRADIDLKSLQAKLLAERDELIHDTKATQKDRQAVALDQASVGRLSRMDALQIQAMQVETERRREIEFNRVKAALKRIENGEYGYCVACDEKIGTKRLDMNPAVPTCIDCASR